MAGRPAAAVARGWFPQAAGEWLAGRFVGYREAATRSGPQPVADVETPDGEARTVWLAAPALRAELERRQPEAGDFLLIEYRGRHPQSGRHCFRVAVVPAEGSTCQRASGGQLALPLAAQAAPRPAKAPARCAHSRPAVVPVPVSRCAGPVDEGDPFDWRSE